MAASLFAESLQYTNGRLLHQQQHSYSSTSALILSVDVRNPESISTPDVGLTLTQDLSQRSTFQRYRHWYTVHVNDYEATVHTTAWV